MADRVIQRNDTADNWQSVNPVLATGEIGIVIDGAKGYKIGDGVTPWNDLPYPANPTNVVQELGNNENAVISQKGVTDKLTELGSKVELANFVNGILTKVSEKNNYENSYNGDSVDVKLTRNEDVFNGVNIVLCRDFYNRSKRLFFNHYDGSRSQGTITFDSNGIAQINIDESVDNAVIADFNAELKTTVYVYSNPQQYFNEILREELNSKLDREIVKREIIYDYLMDNLSNAAWTAPFPSDCILIESVKNDTMSEGAYFNTPLNPYYNVFDLTVEFDIVFDSNNIQYEGHPNFFWWALNGMKLKGEGWAGSTVLQTGKKYNLRFEYKRKSDQIKVYVDGILEAEVTKSASINTNINMQMFGLEKGKNTTFANVVGRRRRIKMYVDDVLRYNFYAVECNGRYGYYESIEGKLYFSESSVEFKK